MKLTLLIVLATMLAACGGSTAAKDNNKQSPILALAQDNLEKAKKYHELQAAVKMEGAKLQSFTANWVDECKARGNGNQLQMGQDGDPICQVPPAPPTPQAAPAAPAPSPAPAPPKK